MQPRFVITCMKPHPSVCFRPPALTCIVCAWASHVGAHTSHLRLCGASARGPAALQHVCGSGPLRRTTPAVRLAGREIRVSISALPPAKQTSRSLSLSGSGRSSTAGLWRGGRTSAATYKETACAVHHLRVAVGSVLVCFGAEMMQEKREKTTITRIPFCTRF